MSVRRLPNDPHFEQFRDQATTLQQFVRAGVPEAIGFAAEFHPHLPEPSAFTRRDAQLVVARSFGFSSWPKLRAYFDVVDRYRRAAHRAEGTPDLAAEFLRLACVTHGDDDGPARRRRAEAILADHPEIATANVFTAAAVGDVDGVRGGDPRAEGGPHRWPPLLYLAYSTVEMGSHLDTARVLLDAGADPGAAYLWEGLPSPYTALTGALTTGHAAPLDLARLLLERGANANDPQALYELGFTGDHPEPIELLFAYGLGHDDGGVWYERLGPWLATPRQLVEDELIRAASANWPRRAQVVLDHRVDITGLGSRHPIFGGRTPYELAVIRGSAEVARILESAGARADPSLALVGAAMRADRPAVDAITAAHPDARAQSIARYPDQISVAADLDRLDAVVLLTELGFDVNAPTPRPHEQTALHGAAYNGNLAMVTYLVDHGGDLTAEDCSFHATPLGWAEHNGQEDVARLLRSRAGHAPGAKLDR